MSTPFTSLLARIRDEVQESYARVRTIDPRSLERLRTAAESARTSFLGAPVGNLTGYREQMVRETARDEFAPYQRAIAPAQRFSDLVTRHAADVRERQARSMEPRVTGPLSSSEEALYGAARDSYVAPPAYTPRDPLGAVAGFLNEDIPPLRVAREAVGEGARYVMENQPVLLGTAGMGPAGSAPASDEHQERMGDIGETVKYLVPVKVWEVALEVVPGVGTIPDLQRLVREGSPEAIAAVRRALRDPRVSEAVQGAKRALKGGELGELPVDPFDAMKRGADDAELTAPERVVPEDTGGAPPAPFADVEEPPIQGAGGGAGKLRPFDAGEALPPDIEQMAREQMPTLFSGSDRPSLGPEPAALPAAQAPAGLSPPPPEPPAGAVVAAGDGMPPDDTNDVLMLTETIRKAKRLKPEQQRAFAAERKQRAGKVGGILEGSKGDAAFQRAQGSLKGEFEGHATFEAPTIDPEARLRMVEEIRTTDRLRPFEKLNAKSAFDKVMSGRLPEPAELEKLERVFGPEFSQAVLDKAPATWAQLAVDVLTLPKTFLTSFDISFPLRQGIVLAPGHFRAWLSSWGPMIRALGSKKVALEIDAAMQADPLWPRFVDSGGYHAPVVGGARAQREESFASRLVEKLPWISGSQRGFVTFGNKLRFGAWKDLIGGADAVGDDAVDAAFSKFVNHATGRGDVPFRAGEVLPGLSAFFSLRNFVSRFQMLADPVMVKDVPLQVRGKIAGDLAKFFASGVTALGLLKLAHDNGVPGFENVTVEANPRSTDFGKIRVGDRRYDFWTGYSQMARYAAQVMAGERLAELPDGSKALVPINRKKYALRFLESKLDPTLGLLIDLYEGETYTGEKLKGDLPTLRREVYNRVVPLFIQDLNESLQKYGPMGAAFSVPAAIGVSVQDYETSEGAKQHALLTASGYESIGQDVWKELVAEGSAPKGYGSIGEFKKDTIADMTAEIREESPEASLIDAQAAAERIFDRRYGALEKSYSRITARLRERMRSDPKIAEAIVATGGDATARQKELAGVP